MSQEQETTKEARTGVAGGTSPESSGGNGAGFDSIGAQLIRTGEQPWIDMGGGNQVIVLRVSKETGFFSILIKAPAGQVNAPHTHIGAADFYVISGGFDYRGGSARTGDWVYEPAGAIHDATTHPMDTIYLANSYGPIAFHGKDGGYSSITDWRAIKAMAERAGQPRPNGGQRAARPRAEAAASGAPRVGAPMAFDPLDASIVRTNERPWLDMGGGNQVIVLRVSRETGFFSLLIKAPAGQVNAPHTHIGAADFYVISGGFDYRGGSARAGDWVYEPAGAVHEATTHPMDTVYLANSNGPVAFHGKDGGFSGLFDWRTIAALAARTA
jgi:anti-sigma factor ChrR (cupin superfamily)